MRTTPVPLKIDAFDEKLEPGSAWKIALACGVSPKSCAQARQWKVYEEFIGPLLKGLR